VIPENPDVGLDGVPMVPPAPEMILHKPEPDAGEFAASVVDDPQIFWLVPALAVVGTWLTVTGKDAQAVVLHVPAMRTK
jgi:hypothetical protein